MQTSERNGKVVAAIDVSQSEEVMLIGSRGTLIRTSINEISIVGRNTQGVRLINLAEQENLVGVQAVLEITDEDV